MRFSKNRHHAGMLAHASYPDAATFTFGEPLIPLIYGPRDVGIRGIEMAQKTLEDIPGVGPAISEKLREAGYRVDVLAPVSHMAENLIEFE